MGRAWRKREGSLLFWDDGAVHEEQGGIGREQKARWHQNGNGLAKQKVGKRGGK